MVVAYFRFVQFKQRSESSARYTPYWDRALQVLNWREGGGQDIDFSESSEIFFCYIFFHSQFLIQINVCLSILLFILQSLCPNVFISALNKSFFSSCIFIYLGVPAKLRVKVVIKISNHIYTVNVKLLYDFFISFSLPPFSH